MQAPLGILQDDDTVIVQDQAEANRLYNKGFSGRPAPGGVLVLTLIEAAQLLEEKRLRVQDHKGENLDHGDLLVRGCQSDERFEIPLLAYRDIRGRGLVAKHANKRALDFLLYRRGEQPKKHEPGLLAGAFSERETITAEKLKVWLDDAVAEKTGLLATIVDEEGDVTHYRVAPVDLKGKRKPVEANERKPIATRFLVDRVVAWGDEAKDLHRQHFLGQKLPNGIQLSLVEAAALLDKNVIAIHIGNETATKEDPKAFDEAARAIQPDLSARLAAYRDLHERGMIVKTGFKFGTHFRLYDEHPDDSHAPWLVHVVDSDWEATWPELSRAIRLAHGVRKQFVLAVVDPTGQVHTVAFDRLRL